jgi:hypothetical protein
VCVITWNAGALGEGTQEELKAAAVEEFFVGLEDDVVVLHRRSQDAEGG